MRVTYVLPVIPVPRPNTCTVLIITTKKPYFAGHGNIDLQCGGCRGLLADGIGPGSVGNLVLKCPHCYAYNAISEIRPFVDHLLQAPKADLAKLARVLREAQDTCETPEAAVNAVMKAAPEIGWLERLVLPKDPGQFWALIAVVIAFLAYLQTCTQEPRPPVNVLINNFYQVTTVVNPTVINSPTMINSQAPARARPTKVTPSGKVGRNEPCPCDSGLKHKKCCGMSR